MCEDIRFALDKQKKLATMNQQCINIALSRAMILRQHALYRQSAGPLSPRQGTSHAAPRLAMGVYCNCNIRDKRASVDVVAVTFS
jgi:hypothetical protein